MYQLFEQKEDGDMIPLSNPRVTARECLHLKATMQEVFGDLPGFNPSNYGVYREVDGGWEQVIEDEQ